MNVLIVNQSVIDMCGSFLMLLIAVVEIDGSDMSRDSIRDQFTCRFWLARIPLWNLLTASTYGILLTALDRYLAIKHPVWYKVRALLRTRKIHKIEWIPYRAHLPKAQQSPLLLSTHIQYQTRSHVTIILQNVVVPLRVGGYCVTRRLFNSKSL